MNEAKKKRSKNENESVDRGQIRKPGSNARGAVALTDARFQKRFQKRSARSSEATTTNGAEGKRRVGTL
jgi:hypothetical protein